MKVSEPMVDEGFGGTIEGDLGKVSETIVVWGLSAKRRSAMLVLSCLKSCWLKCLA